MKTFLISIASVIGLFAVATAVVFVFKPCSIQESWPMSSWCGTASASSRLIEKIKPKQLKPATALYTIAFTIKVPKNTPKHTVIYFEILNEGGRNFKMEKKA